MLRVFRKIILNTWLILCIFGVSFAIDTEYKNTLNKIELIKSSDNSYLVNLYTQKRYSDVVKIIKKNDLNYYILLPETKNSVTQTAMNSNEIRNVTTNTYSYANQDVNNGYTKININTTKPLTFNVNVKVSSHVSTINDENQVKIAKNENVIIEKKNLPVQKAFLKLAPKQIETISDSNLNLNDENQKITYTNKSNVKEKAGNNEIYLPNKQDIQPSKIMPVLQVDTKLENDNNIEDINEVSVVNDIKKEKISIFPSKWRLYKLAKKMNIAKRDIFIISFLLIVIFLTVIRLLLRAIFSFRKNKNQRIIDIPIRKNKYYSKTKNVNSSEKGQYFIFDNGAPPINLLDTQNSKIRKNYELSSYEPDLNNNYQKIKKQIPNDNVENEYDIIQKILREDSIIQIDPCEFAQNKNDNNNQKTTLTTKEKNIETQKEEKENIEPKQEIKKDEPIVLSKIEIAPERGFMCVSYNDNINLMGYIYDDVFAIYDFKRPHLENYNIKYRLVNKEADFADFMLKLDDTKILVKVTKNNMLFQVAM